MKRLLGNELKSTQTVPPFRPEPSPKPTPPSGTLKTYRFIAVDVETANSNTHSICQIGLAAVADDGQIDTTSILVDPEESFETFNTKLHGINQNTIEGAPTFKEALQKLRVTLERHPLVQHSTFDKGAFDAACAMAGVPILQANWSNSVTIARNAWPELKGNGGHGLASLKNHLGLEFIHHDAKEDARAAAEIVLLAETKTGENFTDLAKPAAQRKRNYPEKLAIEGNQNGPLYGHVACFTGKLSMSRTQAATLAASAGITVKKGVSKTVTLVVVGEQDLALLEGHSKSKSHRRAEELIEQGQNLRIIGEQDFRYLLDAAEVV